MDRRPREKTGNTATQRGSAKERRHLKLVSRKPSPRHCTLLDLVRRVQDMERGDEEVVATIARLIETGRVVLRSTFTGATAKPPRVRKTGTADLAASTGASRTLRSAR